MAVSLVTSRSESYREVRTRKDAMTTTTLTTTATTASTPRRSESHVEIHHTPSKGGEHSYVVKVHEPTPRSR
jgi:hypothetical protein